MSERRLRLDQLLTHRGFARSRSQAADAVRRGLVRVEGARAEKPGRIVDPDALIELDPGTAHDVSRAGAKLAHGLDHFAIDPAALTCLDIGASTGGFCQVLLERGAARVYAVDVGAGQLHAAIARDPRVINLERTDARALNRYLVPREIDLIVADVSFISLEKALPAALGLARADTQLVALIKPQFELGPGAVGKDGVVHDESAREDALASVGRFLESHGWCVMGHTPSPIAGKSGNREWLIAAVNERTP